MNFDATFWVAISFFIFLGVLFYFKVPQKVFKTRENDEWVDKTTDDYFAGKNVLLLSLPGAFTPI